MQIIVNGKPILLTSRTALMAHYLVELQADLEGVTFGSLTFHLAGRKIVPELTRSYRPLKGPETSDQKR